MTKYANKYKTVCKNDHILRDPITNVNADRPNVASLNADEKNPALQIKTTMNNLTHLKMQKRSITL